MKKKPLILIVNDDGIQSPGLLAAAEAVEDIADILIVAPHVQQTGMGRAFVRNADTGIIGKTEVIINKETIAAYGVHGTPAFSVAHGVLELADRKPDLCISGINYGSNMGTVLTCSGTLGAAFEAVSHEIPAIAISLEVNSEMQYTEEFEKLDFGYAQNILRLWTRVTLEQGMPKGVDIWNINIPKEKESEIDFRITTQSRNNYIQFVQPKKRDFDKPYALKSDIKVENKELEKESDLYAVLVDKTASITPINICMSVPVTEEEIKWYYID